MQCLKVAVKNRKESVLLEKVAVKGPPDSAGHLDNCRSKREWRLRLAWICAAVVR